MSKIVVIGDIHGKSVWKLIVHREKPDTVIFIGDYFDSYDFTAIEQLKNFDEIIEYKKANTEKVILLVGNHDGYINPDLQQYTISGYQPGAAPNISFALQENKHLLQMCYQHENKYLFSHAGVSETWLDINKYEGINEAAPICKFVNELWEYKPIRFAFNGREPTGDNQYQTPIWIRPRSLMADCQSFKKSFIQIVGHTQQSQIDIKGKATGGRYYFIDTLGTSGEYLILKNNEFSTGKIW